MPGISTNVRYLEGYGVTSGVTKLPTGRNALRAHLCFIKREFDKMLIYVTDLY